MKKLEGLILVNIFVIISINFFVSIDFNLNNLAQNNNEQTTQGDLRAAYPDDIYEENDGFGASSAEISPGHYSSLISADEDWFKVYVLLGSIIKVDIFFDHNFGDINLELRDDSNNQRDRSDTWQVDSEHVFYKAHNTGYYYIWVMYPGQNSSYNMDVYLLNETTVFEDTFDSGAPKPEWSGIGSGYWHITSYDCYSSLYSLWCANESSKTYKKKIGGIDVAVHEFISLNNLDLRNLQAAELTFRYNKSTEPGDIDRIKLTADISGKQIYIDHKFTNNIFLLNNSMSDTPSTWEPFTYDLSPLCGHNHINLIFSFDTDSNSNDFMGFMMDNVKITGNEEISYEGSSLKVKKGDEFIYWIETGDKSGYSQVLGSSPLGKYEDRIKIEIESIINQGDYWDVNTLFWEPDDDFKDEDDADLFVYKVYKSSINIKDNCDFFIPKDNVWAYIASADNIDKDYWSGEGYKYNVDHWNYFNEWEGKSFASIRINYDDFKVEKEYSCSTGILRSLRIYQNNYEDDWYCVFDMWLEEDYEYPDDHEELMVNIPGYEILILVASISMISIYIGIKMKKRREVLLIFS